MFDSPSSVNLKKIIVTKKTVEKHIQPTYEYYPAVPKKPNPPPTPIVEVALKIPEMPDDEKSA